MKVIGIPFQYACFSCRKSFKRHQYRPSINRFMTTQQKSAQINEVQQNEEAHQFKCPDCGEFVHFMGQDFKAPKKDDLKAWKIVQKYIESGKIYYRGNQ